MGKTLTYTRGLKVLKSGSLTSCFLPPLDQSRPLWWHISPVLLNCGRNNSGIIRQVSSLTLNVSTGDHCRAFPGSLSPLLGVLLLVKFCLIFNLSVPCWNSSYSHRPRIIDLSLLGNIHLHVSGVTVLSLLETDSLLL